MVEDAEEGGGGGCAGERAGGMPRSWLLQEAGPASQGKQWEKPSVTWELEPDWVDNRCAAHSTAARLALHSAPRAGYPGTATLTEVYIQKQNSYIFSCDSRDNYVPSFLPSIVSHTISNLCNCTVRFRYLCYPARK